MNEVIPNWQPKPEFTPNPIAAPTVRPTVGGSPSVFDNYATFQQVFEMSRALSKSCFVPAAFRGSPESCVIAIDLARRLGVSPLTLFPHLYVVDSKPAFSTQFLITLVNRSGLFNRLEWESGTDGEATVQVFLRWNEKTKETETTTEKVPNVWAVAKLVERRTNKEYKSPRVDMNFANANGWFAKRGSKWRTMPEIMAAYRAASILIKRVCPELTLGLEFAEDVADSVNDVPDLTRDVYLEPRNDSVPEHAANAIDLVAVYLNKIAAAKTVDDLTTVGVEIGAAGLTGDARETVAEAYRNRRDGIAREINAETVNHFLAAVESATTKEKLVEIYNSTEGGTFDDADRQRIYSAIDARAEKLEQEGKKTK